MAEVDHKPLCGSLVLVSGPSRSGKSRWAEHLVRGDPYVTYVATLPSRPDDVSWQERIDQHRRRRPEHWCLLEADQNLTSALSSIERKHSVLLDAVGGFVASCLDQPTGPWLDTADTFIHQLQAMPQTRVLVAEETGWGVVPATAVGGLFRDRLGELTQRIQSIADDSWLVVQGRAVNLRDLGLAVP